ncbi:transitional endoplasmic reticulum ATPase [Nematocida minor]|uniref:transitional endoplasmic reticulum ATPase n=1 Tax=Nematocida minor TaxID=1912983 RepID=UPI00221F39A6|nr:transitional endoplasmic reticulum ATPase [Nematocida minor]KAI5189616.1 transitional endoplasmic reticulum ATPase [Nematocida minor]
MRTNYTAEAIPYELDKDRSRAYMTPSGLRESHLKPGQHVKIACGARETVLKIVPKFDGDENAVYLPREEMAYLQGRPGDLVSVEKNTGEYPEASEVCVVFKRIRKTVERLESVRLMLTDKSIVSGGESAFGGLVRIKENTKVKVTENTKITIETEDKAAPAIGLEKEINELKTFIEAAHANSYAGEHSVQQSAVEEVNTKSLDAHKMYPEGSAEWRSSKGLIVTGETGMGKKTLCLHVLQEIGKEWVRVHGNRAKAIEDAFEYAKLNEPCTVWIDRIDRYVEEKSAETVICIERILEEIAKEKRKIAVIATANDLGQVPKDLKNAHMLDKVVALHAPTLVQRKAQLLAGVQLHKMHRGCSVDLDMVDSAAKRTAGFTRGEIYLLLRDGLFGRRVAQTSEGVVETADLSLEASITGLKIKKDGEKSCCDGQCMARLMNSIVRSIPSASDGVPAEVPNIRFSSIFGQEQAKQKLKEAVIWPVSLSSLFDEMGVTPPKGVLLYGPPGCGKTLIAQALANESGAVFLSIRGPEIMGKYVGESEERVRKVFARARAQTPSIIFIDEIDSIAPHREAEGGQVDKRVVSTLLTEMDGVGGASGVFVLGATNKPWSIDSALMRPGRFDCHVLVDLPEKETRREIIQNKLRKTVQAVQSWKSARPSDSVSLEEYFAEITEGFTGAELTGLCADVAMEAVRFKMQEIHGMKKSSDGVEDITDRLKKIARATKPRIPSKEIETFRAFAKDPASIRIE